jgi:hypothetical protein
MIYFAFALVTFSFVIHVRLCCVNEQRNRRKIRRLEEQVAELSSSPKGIDNRAAAKAIVEHLKAQAATHSTWVGEPGPELKPAGTSRD